MTKAPTEFLTPCKHHSLSSSKSNTTSKTTSDSKGLGIKTSTFEHVEFVCPSDGATSVHTSPHT